MWPGLDAVVQVTWEERMATADVWPTIHAERKALAADLEGITDEQWAPPSMCSG